MNTKISIVTPSYNQDKYIAICIRSVLMQKHKNIEHIIVDGCSTDGSVGILEHFKGKDSRLQYISEPDSGQGDAVNKGFAAATGEIIGWINSDDFYFDDNVFNYVISFFNANPAVDIVYGGMIYVDAENMIKNIRIPPQYNRKLLEDISYIGNTTAFFRKAVIEKHHLDTGYHFVIDHEYMLRITRDFVAKSIDAPLGCFRVHDEAKTQTMSERTKNIERHRRDVAHDIKRNIYTKIRQLYVRFFYRKALFFSNLKFLKKYRLNRPFEIFLKEIN